MRQRGDQRRETHAEQAWQNLESRGKGKGFFLFLQTGTGGSGPTVSRSAKGNLVKKTERRATARRVCSNGHRKVEIAGTLSKIVEKVER